MSSASYTSCTLGLVYVYVLRHKSVSRVVGLVARLIKPSQSVQCASDADEPDKWGLTSGALRTLLKRDSETSGDSAAPASSGGCTAHTPSNLETK